MHDDELATGEVYHIFTKSIAGFKIFNDSYDFSRIISAITYYQQEDHPIKLSRFLKSSGNKNHLPNKERLVQLIAYCILPTHPHFALKQLKDKGISIYMQNLLNSYTRYFNTKYHRKGPLWEGRFQRRLVKTDEQLLHLTRYIHLNPVTAYLVDNPEDWEMSSYREYLKMIPEGSRICEYNDILKINPITYKKFVDDRISYQRELHKIKDLLLE